MDDAKNTLPMKQFKVALDALKANIDPNPKPMKIPVTQEFYDAIMEDEPKYVAYTRAKFEIYERLAGDK